MTTGQRAPRPGGRPLIAWVRQVGGGAVGVAAVVREVARVATRINEFVKKNDGRKGAYLEYMHSLAHL